MTMSHDTCGRIFDRIKETAPRALAFAFRVKIERYLERDFASVIIGAGEKKNRVENAP